MNRCVLRVVPRGLESVGLLPTLPPDVFLEQRSHFSITTRLEAGLEAGFEWLGPRALSSSASGSRRDHWRSRPWSLLLLVNGPSRTLAFEVQEWALTWWVHAEVLPSTQGLSCPEDAVFQNRWAPCLGVAAGGGRGQPSAAAHPPFPRLTLGWDFGVMGRFLRARDGSFLNVITCK